MILVTTGTTHFVFERMVHLVSNIAQSMNSREHIVFQHGITPIDSIQHLPRVEFVSTASYRAMLRYIDNAHVVISHGGPATLFQILESGKIPWVLPREKKYREHVDDHQVCFCRYLAEQKKVKIINSSSLNPRLFKKQTTGQTKMHTDSDILACLFDFTKKTMRTITS